MTIIQSATIADEVNRDLPAQYAATSALQLIGALWSRLQDVDDVSVALQAAFALNTAVGVQLDAIGSLVGQPRDGGAYPNGESDSLYRMKIRAAILRNRSGGTIPDLIAVLKALLDGNDPAVYYLPSYPAAASLTVTTTTALTAAERQTLVDFVTAAKPAGVALHFYIATTPTFAYRTFPDPPFAGYNRGYWAHVYRI